MKLELAIPAVLMNSKIVIFITLVLCYQHHLYLLVSTKKQKVNRKSLYPIVLNFLA